MRQFWLCLCCLWALAPAAGRAAEGELAVAGDGRYSLSQTFMFLEDPGARMTLAEILEPAAQ